MGPGWAQGLKGKLRKQNGEAPGVASRAVSKRLVKASMRWGSAVSQGWTLRKKGE